MEYKIRFQRNDINPPSYQYTKYGGGTIRSSACGPAALVNCLLNGGIADVSIPTMCELAVTCGARQSGGTVEGILLKAVSSRYNFSWKTTSKNAELVKHLKAGGTAILHCGGDFSLFSDGGHYVAAIDIDSSGQIVVADSLYYTGKWSKNAIRKKWIITTKQTGVVKTDIYAIGKATADRNPSYYLISKNTNTTKEDSEMVEKTKFNIDGIETALDAITKNGITYVALREYNDKLGLVTGYNATTGTRIVDLADITVNINGKIIIIPGLSLNGKNYGGIRKILESAGYTVDWDNKNKVILVTKK